MAKMPNTITDTVAESGNNSEMRGTTKMMKRIHNTKKKTKNAAIILAVTAFMALTLVACGGKASGEEDNPRASDLSDGATTAIAEARDERLSYEDGLQKVDVLDGKELVQDTDYLLRFPNAPTEYLTDVLVYVDYGTEERLPSYIFIAKVTDAERSDAVRSALMQDLLDQPKMDSEDIEIEIVAANTYVVAAAAVNGSDIVNKYVVETGDEMPETSADLFALLSDKEG